MDTVKFNSKKAKVVAHRGLSGIERENTYPSFTAAANRSYFGIETDVHVTKDGRFVVIHDETTDRVSEGRYCMNIGESDYSDIADILLPDSDGIVRRRDILIPSLEDYMYICRRYGKICFLELKNHLEKKVLKCLIETVESTGYTDNVIFLSFSHENCVNLRELLPYGQIQWLISEVAADDDIIVFLRQYRLDIDINKKYINAKTVKRLHKNGIKVNCWTCDDKKEAEKLVKCGVDFITTNILE